MHGAQRIALVWTVVQQNQRGAIGFPRVPHLEGKRITAIEFVPNGDLAFTPDGVTVIANGGTADGGTITLTLCSDADPVIADVPICVFDRQLNLGMWRPVVPFVVNWPRSFVRVNAAFPSGTAGSVPFYIHYQE